MITRETVRDKLIDHLNHGITLAQLVDWAEDAMNEGDLDPRDAPNLAEIIARLGAADVEEFGLSWGECYEFLSRLGYKAKVMAA